MGRMETGKMVQEKALPGRGAPTYRGKVGTENWKVFSTPELMGNRCSGEGGRQPLEMGLGSKASSTKASPRLLRA